MLFLYGKNSKTGCLEAGIDYGRKMKRLNYKKVIHYDTILLNYEKYVAIDNVILYFNSINIR